MKVACEGCATKYTIEDDKVAGRTFKIRCRKCARVLVLRGETAGEPAAAAPRWHAVQDGREIGPLDSGELLRRRDAGELDDDSYVWREGFAEWQPLGAVDELRPAQPAAAAPPLQPAPAVAPPPQASAAPAAAPPPQASAAPAGATLAGAPDRGAAAGRLRGERSESSALFTLSGLSKLGALGAGAAQAAAPSGTKGEGSGLIDIRGLARAYEPLTRRGDAARPRAAATSGVGSAEDLPVFPSGAFIAPDVLVPPVSPRSDRRMVVGLAAAFGLLAICATLLVVITLSRREQPPIVGEQPAAPGPRFAANDRAAAPRATPPAVIEAPAAPGPAAPAATPPVPAPGSPAVQPQPPSQSPAAPARTPAASARTPAAPARAPAQQVRTPSTPSAPARPPAAPAAPAAAKCDQVTCVVNGYDSECCRALQGGGSRSPSRPSPSASTLSENLDRAAITEGLATISTRRCGGASSVTGLVKAHVKVSAAGAVTSVTVDSSPDPALAACVVEQARQGRFKPTQRGGSFSYVWRF